MRKRPVILLFYMTLFYAGQAQSPITIGSLLEEMTDFASVARFPSPRIHIETGQ
jgi:hypothetical protein